MARVSTEEGLETGRVLREKTVILCWNLPEGLAYRGRHLDFMSLEELGQGPPVLLVSGWTSHLGSGNYPPSPMLSSSTRSESHKNSVQRAGMWVPASLRF